MEPTHNPPAASGATRRTYFSEEKTLLEWGVLSAQNGRDEGSFTEHPGPWHR